MWLNPEDDPTTIARPKKDAIQLPVMDVSTPAIVLFLQIYP
jgi:hypothetical protein